MKKRIYTLLSFPVFIILYTDTAIAVILVMIFTSIKWKGAVHGIMAVWARSIFRLMGKKLYINGREHFDKSKKYILLANHASMFDITGIMSLYPGVSWFGHERLLKIPLFGKMLLMNDYIPMTMANVRNTRRMLEQLVEKSKGRTVAIFPEGTRTLNGKINPFFRGFVYLLRATEMDILPVTLNGFFKLKPKNRFYINFGAKLEIIIHPALKGEDLVQLNDSKILDTVRSVIESAARSPDHIN